MRRLRGGRSIFGAARFGGHFSQFFVFFGHFWRTWGHHGFFNRFFAIFHRFFMDFGRISGGFWEVLSRFFLHFPEKANFIKYSILPRKNLGFVDVELLKKKQK